MHVFASCYICHSTLIILCSHISASCCPYNSLSCVLSLLFAAIYAHVIVKDNVSDDEDYYDH